jgi:hypothetical protein
MIAGSLPRLVSSLLLGLFLVASGPSPGPSQSNAVSPQVAVDDHLVVHEWGTFTSVAGEDGHAIRWHPLDYASDLPGFVYSVDELPNYIGLRHGAFCTKCDMEATVRMETPVIYFYTDRETTVSARVDFPNGRITEWYPQARVVYSGIDWGLVRLMPALDPRFQTEAAGSHYYQARETDSTPVRVCGGGDQQLEKFLFYRGAGSFALPLSAALRGDRVIFRNLGRESVGFVVLFENRGGLLGYSIHTLASGKIGMRRPQLGRSLDSLLDELEGILILSGLYQKEAKAMLGTWRDSWFQEGLRAFYVVPRKTTDEVLPMVLNPAPAELVRVLVGRTEIVTPEFEKEVRQSLISLESGSPAERRRAAAALERRGRFVEPVLRRILATTTSLILKRRAGKILGSRRNNRFRFARL